MMNPNPHSDAAAAPWPLRFLVEIYWLVVLGVYEALCFFLLSAGTIGLTDWVLHLSSDFIHYAYGPEGTWIIPTLQLSLAIGYLLFLTWIFESSTKSTRLGSFPNRLKATYPGLLVTAFELGGLCGVVLMTANMLSVFYKRFETLKKIGEESDDLLKDTKAGDAFTSPIKCFSNFGYQLFGMCYEVVTMAVQKRKGPCQPPEVGKVLALNTGQFFLGAMFLSYYLYKKALKEIDIDEEQTPSTHWQSNGILAILAYLSFVYFDFYLQPYISTSSDMYLFGLAVVLFVIAEHFPWDHFFGTSSDPPPAPNAEVPQQQQPSGISDSDSDNNRIRISNKFRIHAVFFFLSLAGMSLIFFKKDLGQDFFLYEWEVPQPCTQFAVNEEQEESYLELDEEDPWSLGFVMPPSAQSGGLKAVTGTCKVTHTANLSMVLFRSFTVSMLVSLARTLAGFKSLSLK